MPKKYIDKKYKFSKTQSIGSPDAETDEMLMEVFTPNNTLDVLLDIKNQGSIIIGRTGSGKSAILKYIESTQKKVIRIEPEAMSLQYLSNSTILTYFRQLNVNLNLFYKTLWKHVFIVEFLKLYFGDNDIKKKTVISQLLEKVNLSKGKSNPKTDRALRYLEKFSNDFWATTESRIKELETNIEEKFSNDTGIKLQDLALKLNNEKQESTTAKYEYLHKAESIINSSITEEIFSIINIMKDELFNDYSKKYFIIIDDLDKEWIPNHLRYEMIGAMIEVIKELVPLKGAKIIISLRDNLHQIVFHGYKHSGGQREKFKPLYVDLNWTNEELKELLNKRIEKITDNNLNFEDIFNKKYKNNSTGFDYIIERTFLRPRDIISFVNNIIKNANNKSFFTLDIIKAAEMHYSIDRLHALMDEWGENFGDIQSTLRYLEGKLNGFRLKSIREDEFINIYMDESTNQNYKGDLLDIVKKWKNNEIKFTQFFRELIFIQFKIGVVGIKKSPNYPTYFFYDNNTLISLNDINNDCKIYIHKAFYASLKINVKALEQDEY